MADEQLYVVARTFKAGGLMYTAGDILSAGDIAGMKYGRILVNERKIKPVPQDENELIALNDYFEVRWGTHFAANLAERVSKGSISAEPSVTSASADPTTPGTQTPTGGIVSGDALLANGDKSPEVVTPLATGGIVSGEQLAKLVSGEILVPAAGLHAMPDTTPKPVTTIPAVKPAAAPAPVVNKSTTPPAK